MTEQERQKEIDALRQERDKHFAQVQELCGIRLGLDNKLEKAEAQVAQLTREREALREALGDVTAMCNSASIWPVDDPQGLRFHAMEAAKRGRAALSPETKEPTHDEAQYVWNCSLSKMRV